MISKKMRKAHKEKKFRESADGLMDRIDAHYDALPKWEQDFISFHRFSQEWMQMEIGVSVYSLNRPKGKELVFIYKNGQIKGLNRVYQISELAQLMEDVKDELYKDAYHLKEKENIKWLYEQGFEYSRYNEGFHPENIQLPFNKIDNDYKYLIHYRKDECCYDVKYTVNYSLINSDEQYTYEREKSIRYKLSNIEDELQVRQAIINNYRHIQAFKQQLISQQGEFNNSLVESFDQLHESLTSNETK